ncbi:chemotaxis protein MotB [Gammaproteobacteria bacterium]
MANDERPIIIKKVKKNAGGHHGGAWKLAYADFVTAMMAFFLLMWLLGSTTDGDKKGIADYFMNPWKPSLLGGRGSGDATSVIHGGGEDITRSYGQVKKTNTGTRDKQAFSAEEMDGAFVSNKKGIVTNELKNNSEADTDNEIDAEQIQMDVMNLQKTKEKLQDLINKSELLHQYSGQFGIDITTEGLRIQVVDEDKRPMFDIGSTRMESYATEIMKQIAPLIDQLPNRVSITGHTDARPYSGSGRGYSNWELSTERANAARRALVNGGIKENKFLRIVGLAESVPLDPKNPLNPINRRISIIVMNRTTEHQLIENSGPVVEAGKKGVTNLPGISPIPLPTLPIPVPPIIQPAQPPTPSQSSSSKPSEKRIGTR